MEESKECNIHQLCDVIMKEWERIPVEICAPLVNFKSVGVKTVHNNGGHKILTVWAQLGHVRCEVYSLLLPAV